MEEVLRRRVAALLASEEWASRFGGDEGVEEVLRFEVLRRVAFLMGWTGDWDFLEFLLALAEVLDEWNLPTRVYIQPAPGMLKIS